MTLFSKLIAIERFVCSRNVASVTVLHRTKQSTEIQNKANFDDFRQSDLEQVRNKSKIQNKGKSKIKTSKSKHNGRHSVATHSLLKAFYQKCICYSVAAVPNVKSNKSLFVCNVNHTNSVNRLMITLAVNLSYSRQCSSGHVDLCVNFRRTDV